MGPLTRGRPGHRFQRPRRRSQQQSAYWRGAKASTTGPEVAVLPAHLISGVANADAGAGEIVDRRAWAARLNAVAARWIARAVATLAPSPTGFDTADTLTVVGPLTPSGSIALAYEAIVGPVMVLKPAVSWWS